jgi:hypothetical protein
MKRIRQPWLWLVFLPVVAPEWVLGVIWGFHRAPLIRMGVGMGAHLTPPNPGARVNIMGVVK